MNLSNLACCCRKFRLAGLVASFFRVRCMRSWRPVFSDLGFVRALIIKDLDEFVEPGLLLQEISTGGLGGLFLQGEMHAFVAAVLLGMARLDAFDANTETQPPDGEFAQIK